MTQSARSCSVAQSVEHLARVPGKPDPRGGFWREGRRKDTEGRKQGEEQITSSPGPEDSKGRDERAAPPLRPVGIAETNRWVLVPWWWQTLLSTHLPPSRRRHYRPVTCGPDHPVGLHATTYHSTRPDARRRESGAAARRGSATAWPGSLFGILPVPTNLHLPPAPPTGRGFDFSCLPPHSRLHVATSLTEAGIRSGDSVSPFSSPPIGAASSFLRASVHRISSLPAHRRRRRRRSPFPLRGRERGALERRQEEPSSRSSGGNTVSCSLLLMGLL
ncbi:hypothetical protein SEVIR_8G211450v4 [Setaria viridis]